MNFHHGFKIKPYTPRSVHVAALCVENVKKYGEVETKLVYFKILVRCLWSH